MATVILSLYHGETKVGEGPIKTRPAKFSIAGSAGTAPWTFSTGWPST